MWFTKTSALSACVANGSGHSLENVLSHQHSQPITSQVAEAQKDNTLNH